LGILEINNKTSLLFNFNTERLNGKKIEEFACTFIQLIYAINSKYKNKKTTITG
jgi:hypothetical protein